MDALREKKHVLSAAEENILAQLSEVTGATNDIFKMLNNADLTFGTIIDEDSNTVNLTHGNYITFMESHDREVRKAAFTNMYKAYQALINTIATTYNYNTKNDVVSARIRKYDSAARLHFLQAISRKKFTIIWSRKFMNICRFFIATSSFEKKYSV